MEFKRISVDTSKAVFTLHGVDAREHVVLRRGLRRGAFEPFFAGLPSTDVGTSCVVARDGRHWG